MNKKLTEHIIRSYYKNNKQQLDFYIPLVQNKIRTLKEANVIAGTLSKTSKMPCRSYGITAKACQVGSAMKDLNKQKLIRHASLVSMTLPKSSSSGAPQMKGFKIACTIGAKS